MSLGTRLAGACRVRDSEILWAWAGLGPGPTGRGTVGHAS